MYKGFLFNLIDQAIQQKEIERGEAIFARSQEVPRIESEIRGLKYIKFLVEVSTGQHLKKVLDWFEQEEMISDGLDKFGIPKNVKHETR